MGSRQSGDAPAKATAIWSARGFAAATRELSSGAVECARQRHRPTEPPRLWHLSDPSNSGADGGVPWLAKLLRSTPLKRAPKVSRRQALSATLATIRAVGEQSRRPNLRCSIYTVCRVLVGLSEGNGPIVPFDTDRIIFTERSYDFSQKLFSVALRASCNRGRVRLSWLDRASRSGRRIGRDAAIRQGWLDLGVTRGGFRRNGIVSI
jgi:hypothetical protein